MTSIKALEYASDVSASPDSAARDRGYASLILTESSVVRYDLNGAVLHLANARSGLEAARDQYGSHLADEVEGMVAVSNGWWLTASRRFDSTDSSLEQGRDILVWIYRLRRLRIRLRLYSARQLVDQFIDRAIALASSHGVPIMSRLRNDQVLLQAIADGRAPAVTKNEAWYSYWKHRLPRPLAARCRRATKTSSGSIVSSRRSASC